MPSSVSKTQSIVNNHLREFFQQDIEGVLRDYSPSAVLIARDGTYRGVEQIRGFFSKFFASLPPGFLEAFKFHRQEFVGEAGYIVWEAAPWALLGTDTFVVRDGRIVLQTYASDPASW